jgi:hypothetical protein
MPARACGGAAAREELAAAGPVSSRAVVGSRRRAPPSPSEGAVFPRGFSHHTGIALVHIVARLATFWGFGYSRPSDE